MPGDTFDLQAIDGHYRMPTAIGAGGAVHVLLHLARQDLELFVGVMPGRYVAAKGKVLCRLRGSEPQNFGQVGNHASEYIPRLPARQAQCARMATGISSE